MFRLKVGRGGCVFRLAAGAARIHANAHDVTLVMTMTNAPETNQIKVSDANTHVVLQTWSTHGRGGVGGNGRRADPSRTGRRPDLRVA